jgi:ABC-2 type transport system ATP-binding protein
VYNRIRQTKRVNRSIQAEGLVKIFHSRGGDVRALDGVDLEVPEGTVLGLLGPNGAGKTTAVRVLTTLLKADTGTARVAGYNVKNDADNVRRHIGLSGQYSAVDEYLTARENLVMIGRLYHLSKKQAEVRAAELLDRFSLDYASERMVKGFSGGMRRRLDLAGALVAAPPVLFLDEPTTGLDPRSRIDLWEVISQLVKDGTTLLLTTQYLEEADKLADKIAVVDRGKVIARGTSNELKAEVGGEHLDIIVSTNEDVSVAARILAEIGQENPVVDDKAKSLTVPVVGGAQTLIAGVRALDAEGVHLLDVGLRRPTLDDVFLALTGQRAESEADEEEEMSA